MFFFYVLLITYFLLVLLVFYGETYCKLIAPREQDPQLHRQIFVIFENQNFGT